jgi:CRP/FNR family transcriptional regulator, cyclic AMP receptor protein
MAMDVGFFLKASPLLKGFTNDGVKIIQAATTPRRVQAGVPLFVEHMPGEALFVIADGAVELYVSRNGAERSLALLRAPDHFGEISLLQPGPRRVSARAHTATTLLEITRRDFLNLQKQRPQACLKLMLNIVELFGIRAGDAAPVISRLV